MCIRDRLRAVEEATAAGYLGHDVLGKGITLRVTPHAGAGAYICGEETALLDSLEGRRGQPRLKPPFPGAAGLYSRPTSVNNVETIASVPSILLHGADSVSYTHLDVYKRQEKSMEYRTWVQGVTFCTRMDYLTPMFQETAYCLAVEKLLGITDQILSLIHI